MPARAKLPPGEGKRVPLNMRTTRELREKIEKNAANSGRSLVQEVEHRLEQSFQNERAQQNQSRAIQNAFFEGLGGREHYPLLVLVGSAVRMVEESSGQKWRQDFETAAQVKEAITTIIEAFSPKATTPAEEVFAGLRGTEIGLKILRFAQEVGLSKSTPSKQE